MRACLILCFTLTIQSVLCEDTGLFKYKDVKFKSYKDLIHPKVAIWSSKWQSKKGLYPKKASSNLYAKRPNTDARFRDYTAFAPYDENNRFIDVPDSPYFPIDHHFQQRTRIKKVLPENYPLLSRVRRAAPKQAAKPVAKNLPPLKVVKQGKLPAKAPGKTGNTQVKKAARTLAKGSAKLPRPANKVRQASNAARNLNKRQKPKRQVLRKAKNNKKNQSGQRRNRNRRAQGQINNNQRNNKQPNNQKNQDQAGRRNVKPSQAKPGAKQAAKPAAKKQKDASARRLISAKDADIEEFPYVVSIQKDSEHWCAGALLNQRMVVTTANCVWKSSSLSRMRVRVGSRHLDHGGQKVGIQEVMKHPHWSIRRNPDNDVALLLLDREVK